MTYWVFLVIVFGEGSFDKTVSLLPFPDMRSCGNAIETVDTLLRPAFPDLSLHCMETERASGSIRPQPRPEDLG